MTAPPTRRCTCGDLEPLHVIRTNGTRGACSTSGCGCARFEEAKP